MSTSDASNLGPLLILGLHDHRWSNALQRVLHSIRPGGVLVYAEALRDPSQIAQLLHRISQTLSSPPFLAIEEEGGSVHPLKAILPPLPSPRVLARRGPPAVRRCGELIGATLRFLGFNLDFAPRLDLSNPDAKPIHDTQTFGTDPKHVVKCGRAFIEGLSKHEILACGKHFPGRSNAEYDEKGFPVVGKPMAELWREDLLPFRELLGDMPLVEVANIAYKAYDFDVPQPAALSAKVVHDLLRVKLRYRGLAVADLLGLLEEISLHSRGQEGAGLETKAFSLSVKAGCDLQVVTWGPKLLPTSLAGIQMEVESASLNQERVEETLKRIRGVKARLKRPTGKLSTRGFDRLLREFEEFSQQVRGGGELAG